MGPAPPLPFLHTLVFVSLLESPLVLTLSNANAIARFLLAGTDTAVLSVESTFYQLRLRRGSSMQVTFRNGKRFPRYNVENTVSLTWPTRCILPVKNRLFSI
jgi:hypothetical protein